ncbi:MAG: hypothetical protein BWY71_00551 [Planctomycetes bacterium ADurb.Bin412]|nr:MAG: hypothetical protein BWY71_00551 [Planctomycetes bacterium ADurb.Bin412]
MQFVADGGLDTAADLLRRSQQPEAVGHVEEGLVDGDRLDAGGKTAKDIVNLMGAFQVAIHPHGQQDGVGT